MMAKKKAKKAGKGSSPIIVKRGAESQNYDERKVYASAYFACRNAHLSEKESEKIAEKVASSVSRIARKEKIILSDRIFMSIVEELKVHSEDASFLYETHRDLS